MESTQGENNETVPKNGDIYNGSTERDQLESEFKQVLHSSNGLKDKSNLNEIISTFDKLIKLQYEIDGILEYPNTWWAIDLLLYPVFTSKFEYHFISHSQTNKLSKPEWPLEFTESFLEENISFLQFIVDDSLSKFDLIGAFEIITSLLASLRSKFINSIENINNSQKQGRLLSHLIHELNNFDLRISNKYKYNHSLTSDILLSNDSIVQNIIKFELDMSLNRFHEITNANEAYQIDVDYKGEPGSVRPSYSSYGISKLITILNGKVKELKLVKYQLKYLSKIQMHILETYYESIQESNDDNIKYIKLVQAIDLLDSLKDVDVSKYRDDGNIGDFRGEYDHKLNQLTNYDIKSLLIRLQNI
ncbi:unnamed protein product [Candida verbasci]|uniref:Uncharacterized protein n=1 Tax=Candida verbasci TaxID=1227364 RepID=A0A9W4XBS7_9ASCO|nr:unnamed protein product [Candida verbasci]